MFLFRKKAPEPPKQLSDAEHAVYLPVFEYNRRVMVRTAFTDSDHNVESKNRFDKYTAFEMLEEIPPIRYSGSVRLSLKPVVKKLEDKRNDHIERHKPRAEDHKQEREHARPSDDYIELEALKAPGEHDYTFTDHTIADVERYMKRLFHYRDELTRKSRPGALSASMPPNLFSAQIGPETVVEWSVMDVYFDTIRADVDTVDSTLYLNISFSSAELIDSAVIQAIVYEMVHEAEMSLKFFADQDGMPVFLTNNIVNDVRGCSITPVMFTCRRILPTPPPRARVGDTLTLFNTSEPLRV